MKVTHCEICKGTGRVYQGTLCQICGGTGHIVRER